MIIGTHNSMTYLPPKKWWGYLLIPFWRCQRKTWLEQWNAGVRCFDLRITFENDGTPVFAHGIVKLEGHAGMFLYDIVNHARKLRQPVGLRVVCEDLTASAEIAERFKSLCELMNKFDCVVPFEGRRKGDWKLIYGFAYKPKLNQFVGSMATDARWYEKLMPWFYAKRMNEHNQPQEVITLYDFI